MDDIFDQQNIKRTHLLSEAPDWACVSAPQKEGSHVIKRTIDTGYFTVTRWSQGNWPLHERIYHEIKIDGGYLECPTDGSRLTHFLVAIPHDTSLAHVLTGDGYTTHLGSYRTTRGALDALQNAITHNAVGDKAAVGNKKELP